MSRLMALSRTITTELQPGTSPLHSTTLTQRLETSSLKNRTNSDSAPTEDATASGIHKTTFSALSLNVTMTKVCHHPKYKNASRSHPKRAAHQKTWTKHYPNKPSTSRLSSLITYSQAFNAPICSRKTPLSVTAVLGSLYLITAASTTASTGWTQARDLKRLTLASGSHQID